jgi:Rieske Fe-S protein
MNRRDVLKAGVVTGALAATGVSLNSCASETDTVPAGSISLEDIPVGGGVFVAEPPIVVTQPSEGEVVAFSSICPHQGCKVNQVFDNQIFCPCHGSIFSALDGSVIVGPATEGLSAATFVLDGTKVSVG